MAKINYFSNEIQLSSNHTYSVIFEILGVDKQIFISCGQDEPYGSPKKAYFSHVIGIYFLSFINEYHVYYVLKSKIDVILSQSNNTNQISAAFTRNLA